MAIKFLNDINFLDSDKILVGTGNDLQIHHSSGHSYISHETNSDLYIQNTADDRDVILQCDKGDGDVIPYVTLDGSEVKVVIGGAVDVALMINDEYTFPTSDGSNGQVLTTDGSGTVSWSAAGGGDITGVTLTADDSGTAEDLTDNVNLTIAGGNAISTTATSTTLTINHDDTSSQASVNNSGRTYIQDITLDGYGHVTGITSASESVTNTNTQNTYASSWVDSTNDVLLRLTRGGAAGAATQDIKLVAGDGISLTPDGTDMTIASRDASSDDKGIIKISSSQNSVATQTVTTTANRQYAIQTDTNGVGSVNVPWTDTNTTTTADVKTALGAAMGSNALQIGDGSTTTTFPGAITATGNINANGNIVGDDGTNITNINSIEADSFAADADNTTYIGMAATEISCLVEDTDVFTVTSSTFNFDAAVKTTINKRKFAKTSAVDGNANGDIVYFGGTTSMTTGAIYHYKSDGTWELADADSAVNCDGLLGVALGAASDTNGVLLRGMVTLDHDPGAVGDVLFLSTTAGDSTATAPSGNGDIVRVIGYCLDASNGQIYFNPDGTYVEVSA